MCICPECGTIDYKVGKVCSRTKETICIDCCKKCPDYFKNEAYVSHGCRYISEKWHQKEMSKNELHLNRIRSEIDKKYRSVDYFYQTDRPRIAEKIEAEITRLKYEEKNIMANMT